MNVLKTSYVWE